VNSCTQLQIKHESDRQYQNSSTANSPELLVKIDKVVCKDMDGIVGLCSKRVNAKSDIQLSHPPLPYQYRFIFTCSESLKSDFAQDIPKEVEFEFTIRKEAFKRLNSFICIGEITPKDRPEAISAKYEIRFKVVSEDYIKREKITVLKHNGTEYLILGAHSYLGMIFQGNQWRYIKEKTIVKFDPAMKVISESYMMRYSYYGL
jgi:hypothetical protein